MKKLFTIITLLISLSTFAQKLTFTDIVGTYTVSKLYINDTLFYDKNNPAKADKNVLIDVGKQVAIYSDKEDSTLAIALFYKDIRKALNTYIYFGADSTTHASYSSGFYGDDMITRFIYNEQWSFDGKKQHIYIMLSGKITEHIPVKKVNGVVTLFINDRKEKTKLELEKMY
jgi:hypothetical protein